MAFVCASAVPNHQRSRNVDISDNITHWVSHVLLLRRVSRLVVCATSWCSGHCSVLHRNDSELALIDRVEIESGICS